MDLLDTGSVAEIDLQKDFAVVCVAFGFDDLVKTQIPITEEPMRVT